MSTTPKKPSAKLEAVRAWVVKACPGLSGLECRYCGWTYDVGITLCSNSECGNADFESFYGEIGIAEVLRAIGIKFPRIVISPLGDFLIVSPELTDYWYPSNKYPKWNLSDDNLDHQKPEIIDFLFSLIR